MGDITGLRSLRGPLGPHSGRCADSDIPDIAGAVKRHGWGYLHPMKAVQIPTHATRHPENNQSDHRKLVCCLVSSGLIYAQSGWAHYDRSG